MEFVLIPAGTFRMGSAEGQVYVDQFAMAVHPVTRTTYDDFRRATGHPAPREWQLDPSFRYSDYGFRVVP